MLHLHVNWLFSLNGRNKPIHIVHSLIEGPVHDKQFEAQFKQVVPLE